jgi:hypothetical protein
MIAADLLEVGENVVFISLTSTSGVTRTLQFTLRKAQAVFSARCGYTSDSSGDAEFGCSTSAGSEAIQSITYTINGGEERTGGGG